jgi:hypothetical protein
MNHDEYERQRREGEERRQREAEQERRQREYGDRMRQEARERAERESRDRDRVAASMGSELSRQRLISKGEIPPPNSNGSSSTVICTLLHENGLMSAADYHLSAYDARTRLSAAHLNGYHFWAVPLVRVMRHHPRLLRLLRPLAQARADEIARIHGEATRGSLPGKVLKWVGEPICLVLGVMVGAQNFARLYPADAKDDWRR